MKTYPVPEILMRMLLKAANDAKEHPWMDDVSTEQIEAIITVYLKELRRNILLKEGIIV